MKIYLAGPEVFLPDPIEMGHRKIRLCKSYGYEGLYPLDNEIAATSLDASRRIFEANIRMIDAADLVVANVTPFRGVSADPGTVFEIGYAHALGKVIYGYSNNPLSLVERATGRAAAAAAAAAERLFAADGLAVENFGLAENLMIAEAIQTSGGRFFKPSSGGLRPWTDLEFFRKCLVAADAAHRTSPAEAGRVQA